MNNETTSAAAVRTAMKPTTAKEKNAKKSQSHSLEPSEKELQMILDFLGKLGPFEADAIRVVTTVMRANGQEPIVKDEGLACVNRYLNHGLAAQGKPTELQAMTHRHGRGLKLLDLVAPFLDKEQFARATRWTLGVATDPLAIEKAIRMVTGDNPEQLTLF